MTIELFVAGVTFGISIFKTIIQQRQKFRIRRNNTMWGFVIGTLVGLGSCIVLEIVHCSKSILV